MNDSKTEMHGDNGSDADDLAMINSAACLREWTRALSSVISSPWPEVMQDSIEWPCAGPIAPVWDCLSC